MGMLHDKDHHIVPYSVYINVWLALLVLTVITVAVSYVDMRHVAVLTAVFIATGKSMLVLLYFMHIRFGKPMYMVMILVVLAAYAVFIGLTFFDYGFRA